MLKNLVIFCFSTILFTGCATSGGGTQSNGKWKCKAKGLQSAHYTGSSYAKIHLDGYLVGGSYKAVLNDAKNMAKGVTADGTPFSCSKL